MYPAPDSPYNWTCLSKLPLVQLIDAGSRVTFAGLGFMLVGLWQSGLLGIGAALHLIFKVKGSEETGLELREL